MTENKNSKVNGRNFTESGKLLPFSDLILTIETAMYSGNFEMPDIYYKSDGERERSGSLLARRAGFIFM